MTNCYDELIETLEYINKTVGDIKWFIIKKEINYGKNDIVIEFNQSNVNEKLEKLKTIEYDSGYGGQELFGCVVFNDNTWLTRGEYDGSEWWEYQTCPSYEKARDYLLNY